MIGTSFYRLTDIGNLRTYELQLPTIIDMCQV